MNDQTRDADAQFAGIPWYAWCAALAITSGAIGAQWDLSWHRSIGRDTFWTPAHIAVYACGLIEGVSSAYLIFKATIWKPAAMAARSVSLFGLRGPLGAFVAVWGGLDMLAAGPFDNWWHVAYGLDATVLSPPHVVVTAGGHAIMLGAMLLVLSHMNRVADESRAERDPQAAAPRRLQWLLLYLSGMFLVVWFFLLVEILYPTRLHAVQPYAVLSLIMPFSMAVLWKASRHPWANTIAIGIGTAAMIGFILILPLFPAQPKLGPIFHPITHFVPPQFPVLLIAPAVALDLLWSKWRGGKWALALASGAVFVAVLLAFEWPFATFLVSRAAENRFFGGMYYGFAEKPYGPFGNVMHGPRMIRLLAETVVFAAVSTRMGMVLGDWMREVRR